MHTQSNKYTLKCTRTYAGESERERENIHLHDSRTESVDAWRKNNHLEPRWPFLSTFPFPH